MKNPSVPNAKNWPEQKKPKRGGIRAIDQGTNYDVPGKLRRLVHQIEKGEHGIATDVVCAVRYVGLNGKIGIRTMYTGKNTTADLNLMVDYLKRDIVGG